MKVTTALALLIGTTKAVDGDDSTTWTVAKECEGD